MFVDVRRSFAQLFDPKILKLLILASFISLAVMVALVMLMYQGLVSLPFDTIPWVGSWLISSDLGGWIIDSSLGLVLVLFFLLFFPYVLLVVTGFFQDLVITLVEAKYYPNLPAPLNATIAEMIRSQLGFLLKIILINLLCSPLYLVLLFTGFGVLILSGLVNGYLIGLEYYSMVSLRRYLPKQYRRALTKDRLSMHFYGIGVYLMMLIPVWNLLMPVFGCMMFTHYFYRRHACASFMTTALPE